MILKLLLVVGIISVVYIFFIKKKPALKNYNKNSNQSNDEHQSNDMIKCSTCGIYCDINDALISSNKYYCSDECLEKA